MGESSGTRAKCAGSSLAGGQVWPRAGNAAYGGTLARVMPPQPPASLLHANRVGPEQLSDLRFSQNLDDTGAVALGISQRQQLGAVVESDQPGRLPAAPVESVDVALALAELLDLHDLLANDQGSVVLVHRCSLLRGSVFGTTTTPAGSPPAGGAATPNA